MCVFLVLSTLAGQQLWQHRQLTQRNAELKRSIQSLGEVLPNEAEQQSTKQRLAEQQVLLPLEPESYRWHVTTEELRAEPIDVWHYVQSDSARALGFWIGLELKPEASGEGKWRLSFAKAADMVDLHCQDTDWPVWPDADDGDLEEAERCALSAWRIAGYYFDRDGKPVAHLLNTDTGEWTTLTTGGTSPCGRIRLLNFAETEQGGARLVIAGPDSDFSLTLILEVGNVY